ncbi:hypothetical protein PAT3040_00159 [Paenibacillus agaridevorans]|uniref:Uncharacterized protein n=1 Tax=Paenibacillus agaridevorans TaxID=171404 RepID=A0A2R5EHV5_9BACL|nr:hypothetical protein PAT3040_00159 [Paenibacillus agaridevorans]
MLVSAGVDGPFVPSGFVLLLPLQAASIDVAITHVKITDIAFLMKKFLPFRFIPRFLQKIPNIEKTIHVPMTRRYDA